MCRKLYQWNISKQQSCFEMEILRLRSLRTAHFVAQGCRPFSAENEHTGSFSGRVEPQDDTLSGSRMCDLLCFARDICLWQIYYLKFELKKSVNLLIL